MNFSKTKLLHTETTNGEVVGPLWAPWGGNGRWLDPHWDIFDSLGQAVETQCFRPMKQGGWVVSLRACPSAAVSQPQDNSGWREPQEVSGPTPAQSRVSRGIKPGCSGLVPAGRWKPPKKEIAPQLWAALELGDLWSPKEPSALFCYRMKRRKSSWR